MCRSDDYHPQRTRVVYTVLGGIPIEALKATCLMVSC